VILWHIKFNQFRENYNTLTKSLKIWALGAFLALCAFKGVRVGVTSFWNKLALRKNL